MRRVTQVCKYVLKVGETERKKLLSSASCLVEISNDDFTVTSIFLNMLFPPSLSQSVDMEKADIYIYP